MPAARPSRSASPPARGRVACPRAATRRAALVACGALAGCEGVQSALAPSGPNAARILDLANVMFAGAAIVTAIVTALALWAVFAPPERRRPLGTRHAVVVGGIAFPAVVLTALLVWTLVGAARIVADDPPEVLIEVVGEQWWWRVHYLDERGEVDFVTANEIRLPAGRTVELRLRGGDVIHSLWIPSLAGKLDMIPGHDNRLQLRADRIGVLRGQCAEYCGGAHALMAFAVVVDAPGEFERWRALQRSPAPEPGEARLALGRDAFLGRGCGSCHAVRGTPAAGERGPDLTHLGGRRTLGAGILPVNVGTIAGWIGSNQDLKPGNLMPEFHDLEPDELLALAAWLESLK
jgi:cytochrome c oxidase subunit 2